MKNNSVKDKSAYIRMEAGSCFPALFVKNSFPESSNRIKKYPMNQMQNKGFINH